MKYNFGQFRSSSYSSYVNTLKYNQTDKYSVFAKMEDDPSQENKELEFYDVALDLETSISSHNEMRSYYIRFTIDKMEDSIQTFTLRLVNDDVSQKIETFTVDSGKGSNSYEFIITPSDNYVFDKIHFELHRGFTDYNTIETIDGKKINGRRPKIKVERLQQITNILLLQNNTPLVKGSQLKQLGIQGPPGLLMSINGEQIRVGRSGLYEITNGMPIDFLGFVVEDNEKYFILDYQY